MDLAARRPSVYSGGGALLLGAHERAPEDAQIIVDSEVATPLRLLQPYSVRPNLPAPIREDLDLPRLLLPRELPSQRVEKIGSVSSYDEQEPDHWLPSRRGGVSMQAQSLWQHSRRAGHGRQGPG